MKSSLAIMAMATSAMGQQLVIDHAQLLARGFPPDSVVQLFRSTDFKYWKPLCELAVNAAHPVDLDQPNEVFRARLKPAPATFTITSPLSVTGRVYRLRGTASAPVTDLHFAGLTGDVIDHQFTIRDGKAVSSAVSWEFPATTLKTGTNRIWLTAIDVADNILKTNLTILCMDGPVATVDFPPAESFVAGNQTVLLGHVNDLRATVQISGQPATVDSNGEFVIPIPVLPTNTVMLSIETSNVISIIQHTFYQSPVSITWNGRTAVTKPYATPEEKVLPYLITGSISDTNFSLNIDGRTVIPDERGNWSIRTKPPVKGMLPFTITPRDSSEPNIPQASGIITGSTETMVIITSHAAAFAYSYVPFWDKAHTYNKHFTETFSGGHVDLTLGYTWAPYYPLIKPVTCALTYSGDFPRLWLDQDDFPDHYCGFIQDNRLYPAALEFADYHDSYSQHYYEYDDLAYNSASGCVVHLGGPLGGTKLFRVTIQILAERMWRTGDTGDELDQGDDAPHGILAMIGGHRAGNDNAITVIAREGTNIDATPILGAFNSGWYAYDVNVNTAEVQ